MNPPETNVVRLLETHKIPYRLLPHAEPVFTVDAAAQQRGVVREEMVKSILLCDRQNYAMACVLGHQRLDIRAVRANLPGQWGRLRFATAQEIRSATGFEMGAVAPVGLPASIPVLFDAEILRCPKLNISSGDPMAGLELAVADLLELARAHVVPIAKKDE